MADRISLDEIIELSNLSDLDKFERFMLDTQKNYDNLIKIHKKLVSQYKRGNSDIEKAVSGLIQNVSKLNPALEQDQKQLAAISKSMDIMTANSSALDKKTKDLTDSIDKLTKEQKEVNEATKKTKKTYTELEKLQNKLISLDKQEAKEIANVRAKINQKNKELREEAKNSVKLISVYDNQVRRLNQLSKEYKEYVIQGKESTRAAKAVKKEFDSLSSSIRRAEMAVGQHQRNVGNYPKQFALAARGAAQLASALGFTGVVFALVSAFRNAFRTIADFDEEMTNLAAIAGETREEFKGVEKEIRRVAKSSINTAGDVAKTATALITLGKTKSEIIDLLEPVNDLSIALKASSEEAGQLLVGTLNAFGESSDAAQEYADIIAKVRTTTALDFEGIKDALGFIAPVANSVGVSMAKTGAIIGTLADANVKASRAGRLMATSFGRLAQQGIDLDTALRRVNASSDRTTAAMNIFGAESFSLALILADNIDKTEEYTKTFEEAGGTLEDLTNKQLKSLTAQSKIAGSAWDEFILSIDNGDGIISKFVSGSLALFTEALNKLSRTDEDIASSFITDHGIRTISQYNTLLDEASDKLDEEGKRVAALARQYVIADEALVIYNAAIKDGIDNVDDFKKVQDEFINNFADEKDNLDILNQVYAEYSAQQELAKEKTKKTGDVTRDGVKAAEALARANSKLSDENEFVFESSEDILLSSKELENNLRLLKFGYGDIAEAMQEYSDQADKIVDSNKEIEESTGKTYSKLEEFFIGLTDNVKQYIEAGFEAINTIGNQVFTNLEIRRQNSFLKFEETQQAEIDRLNERKDIELERENLTASAKTAINRRYERSITAIEEGIDRKRTQLQKKQARAAKANALFNAIINTAQGVTAALAQLNPVLAAIIGVLGGIQIGAIASQPLPAFEKGGTVMTDGPIITSEKGSELAVTPDGRMILTGRKGAEVRTDIPRGSEIIPHDLTRKLMEGGLIDQTVDANHKSANSITKGKQKQDFDNFAKAFSLTMERESDYLINGISQNLKRIPVNNWTFDDKGHPVRSIQNGNTIKNDVSLNIKF